MTVMTLYADQAQPPGSPVRVREEGCVAAICLHPGWDTFCPLPRGPNHIMDERPPTPCRPAGERINTIPDQAGACASDGFESGWSPPACTSSGCS